MTIVLPGVRVDATEEGPSDASGDAVINADLVFNDDLAPGVGRHQLRLLKQRRAFPVERMSTITVMDKSTKSSRRVKYLTEKDRPRGAGLNLVVSRGSMGV